jgi:hypothetical protein
MDGCLCETYVEVKNERVCFGYELFLGTLSYHGIASKFSAILRILNVNDSYEMNGYSLPFESTSEN